MIELLLQADRLLNMGMTDQADTIYRRVAEQDPQNAIAVVGIGRCALAREDDQEAYRLAARALTIDPQNDMARRMEARLSEVLTLRGEAPGRPAVAAVDPGAGTTTELRLLVTRDGTPPATPAHGTPPAASALAALPAAPVPPANAKARPAQVTTSKVRSALPPSAATTRSLLGRLLGR